MPKVRLELGATVVEVNPSAPFTVREQLAWEEHFKQSFVTVFRAQLADSLVAEADPDAIARHYQVQWMLWFAWYRLRAQQPDKVPDRFETFVDQLSDWNYLVEPKAQPAEAAPPAPAEDGSLDPTPPSPSDGSPPPADSIPEASPAPST